jgi:hypothetical protein
MRRWMATRQHRALTLLAGTALALVTGCDGMGRSGDAEMRTARAVQHPMLVGVPLPRGYTVVDDRSVGLERGRLRVAKYEFEGSARKLQLHEFFLNQMPPAGFQLMSRREDNGVITLRFESSTEECTLRIGDRGGKSYFVIDVVPLPDGPAPQPEDFPPARAE